MTKGDEVVQRMNDEANERIRMAVQIGSPFHAFISARNILTAMENAGILFPSVQMYGDGSAILFIPNVSTNANGGITANDLAVLGNIIEGVWTDGREDHISPYNGLTLECLHQLRNFHKYDRLKEFVLERKDRVKSAVLLSEVEREKEEIRRKEEEREGKKE